MFSVFVHFGALQNRCSRVGEVTISRKCNENDAKIEVVLCTLFLPKFQVVWYTSRTHEAPKVLYFANKTQYFRCID